MKATLQQIVQAAGKPVKLVFETQDQEMLNLTYGESALLQEKPCDLYFHLRLTDPSAELQMKLEEMRGPHIPREAESEEEPEPDASDQPEEAASPAMIYEDADGARYYVAGPDSGNWYVVVKAVGDTEEECPILTPTYAKDSLQADLDAYAARRNWKPASVTELLAEKEEPKAEPTTEAPEEAEPATTDTDIDPDGALLSRRVSVGSYIIYRSADINPTAHKIIAIEFGRSRLMTDHRLQWMTFDALNTYWRFATQQEIDAAYPPQNAPEATAEDLELTEPVEPTAQEFRDSKPGPDCVNGDSVGEVCVQCNLCGRFNTKPDSSEPLDLASIIRKGDFVVRLASPSSKGGLDPKPHEVTKVDAAEGSCFLAGTGTVFLADLSAKYRLVLCEQTLSVGDEISNGEESLTATCTSIYGMRLRKTSEPDSEPRHIDWSDIDGHYWLTKRTQLEETASD